MQAVTAEPSNGTPARWSPAAAGGVTLVLGVDNAPLGEDAGANSAEAVLAGWNEMRRALRLAPLIPPHEMLPGTMGVGAEYSQLGTCFTRSLMLRLVWVPWRTDR